MDKHKKTQKARETYGRGGSISDQESGQEGDYEQDEHTFSAEASISNRA